MAKKIPTKISFKMNFDKEHPEQFIRVLEELLRQFHLRVMSAVNDHADTLDGSNGVPQLPSYTVAGLPSASGNPRGLIYVSNEVGGATVAFSDGTNWRRVQDRAIVS